MAKDDSLQSISTQLDGKNYAYWSYVMKNFLRGKGMWWIVTGTRLKPVTGAADYAVQLDSWETDNSKIITWINNSVIQSIGTQLAKYDTAKEIWDHLNRLYTQSNFAKQYQLEFDIRALQQQSLSVQEFYAAMSDLWDQLALTEPADLKAFQPYVTRREEQRLVQFLMALRSDFEGLRGSILHRTPLPTVDSVVHELIAEETRIKSNVDKSAPTISTPTVLAATRSQPANQNRLRVPPDECAFCKKKGHWKARCPLLLAKGGNQQPQRSSASTQTTQNKPSGQLQSRPPFRPPSFAATTPSVDTTSDFTPPSALDPQIVEKFKQYIASHPAAMSTLGLSSSNVSGHSVSEGDWDRP